MKTSYLSFFLLFIVLKLPGQSIELSKAQMLEDFDALVEHINNFAVHKDVNSIRLGIDYERSYEEMKKEITSTTSICEFKEILVRATKLVQDLHCSLLNYDYLDAYGKYQIKLNFSDNNYSSIKQIEEICEKASIYLKLPLIYKDGTYIVYADFHYKGDTIPVGTKIVTYNNQTINQYIENNYDLVWPIRWNQKNSQPYHTEFYKFGNQEFQLGIQNRTHHKRITFNLKDTITLATLPQRKIGFFSQKKEQVLYFEDSNVLYIGLGFMDVNQATSIIHKVDSVTEKYRTFSKIIIDIRGNPGGSDMAWRNVLTHLINEKIVFSKNLMFKFNEPVLNFYADQKDKIAPKQLSLLNEANYWTRTYEFSELLPDTSSIQHQGKIYVVQDEYIYSSAENFSNFCFNSEQLISIGMTNDFIGGTQTEPIFKKLLHSGLVVRVEPMLDYSNVKKMTDLYHNNIEVSVQPTVEDYFLKTTHKEDVYNKDFLIKRDRLIKYIINHNP